MNLLAFLALLMGSFIMFVAGLGILRMPDLFTRMHASTKGASLALGLFMVAATLTFWQLGVTTKAILTTVFVFTTAPVAAHLLSRAAYSKNIPLWKGTVKDEARGKIGSVPHRSSPPAGRPDSPAHEINDDH